jgi:hypothetical protein
MVEDRSPNVDPQVGLSGDGARFEPTVVRDLAIGHDLEMLTSANRLGVVQEAPLMSGQSLNALVATGEEAKVLPSENS